MKSLSARHNPDKVLGAEKTAKGIRRMFGAISPRYDLLNHLLSFGRDRAWRKVTVDLTLDDDVSRVLDVCSGTGDLALAYRRKMKEGQVVLADFCPEMLFLAREKLAGTPCPAKTYVCLADATGLPFRDGIFDLACVAFGIRNVADLDAGIREMTRVVRDRGKVVVLEFSQPDNRLFRAVYYLYFRRILPVVGRVVSGSTIDAYGYLPRSVLAFARAEELRERMESAGLTGVTIARLMFGAVTIHVGLKR
jgi:demethylmenaquinone methyltransferase/2-methoxy-6-polyprenyl-1,4-benzoquinol methylase